ncbi:MAG TPA: hypothetical protein VNU93_06830 [Verrucomicrobiae bacterium]|nr:hypothetical protein [Verrucomicrobiae bacterium]
MDKVFLAIVIFAVLRSVYANMQRGQGPERRLGEPWMPPTAPRRKPGASGQRRQTNLPKQLSPWDSMPERTSPRGTYFDPDKEIELRDSAGQEGAWGDEGRSAAETQSSEGVAGTEGFGTEGAQDRTPVQMAEEPLNLRQTQTAEAAVEISGSELTKGVIWAEILGRPRALRPFRGPRT